MNFSIYNFSYCLYSLNRPWPLSIIITTHQRAYLNFPQLLSIVVHPKYIVFNIQVDLKVNTLAKSIGHPYIKLSTVELSCEICHK